MCAYESSSVVEFIITTGEWVGGWAGFFWFWECVCVYGSTIRFFPPVGLLIQLPKGVCSSFIIIFLYGYRRLLLLLLPIRKILLRFLRRCCQQIVPAVRRAGCRMPNPSNRIDDTRSSWARKCSATASFFLSFFFFSSHLVFFFFFCRVDFMFFRRTLRSGRQASLPSVRLYIDCPIFSRCFSFLLSLTVCVDWNRVRKRNCTVHAAERPACVVRLLALLYMDG